MEVSYKGKTAQQPVTIAVSDSVKQFTGYRAWSDGTLAPSCLAYLQGKTGYVYAGATGDGVYRIQPSGYAVTDVYCDMTTDGGGWTLAAWNKGTSGTGTMTTTFFVAQVNPGNLSKTGLSNTASSLNVEALSKSLKTTDVMLKAGAYSSSPLIEKGQGIWQYDPGLRGAAGTHGAQRRLHEPWR